MNKNKTQLINSKSMTEFLDTVKQDVQFTKRGEVYNGRNLIAKQIKAKL